MGFPEDIVWERFKKQDHQCAHCRALLVWDNRGDDTKDGAWEAHHIDGDANNNILSNCACLCIVDKNCHLNVGHDGDYRNGILGHRSRFYLGDGDEYV